MNLTRKVHARNRRGIIGVESAIVMIAFVIVAAALAFVVLNMGFSTTQKAKTTIISGLGEASSGLEVAGKVIGSGHISEAKLNVTAIPIKIASGGESINLDNSTAVKYVSNSITYDDIYLGTLTEDNDGSNDINGEWGSLQDAVGDAFIKFSALDKDPYQGADIGNDDWPKTTGGFIYWTVNGDNDEILDSGEHAILAIVYADDDRPASLETIRAEIIVQTGATLTIERKLPSVSTTVVDLN